MHLWRVGAAAVGGCLLIFLVGCGAESATLAGSANYDGKPIPEGVVRLMPVKPTTGPGGAGEIVNGQFEIGSDGKLTSGTYKVAVLGMRKTGRRERASEAVPVELGGTGKLEMVEQFEQYIPNKYNRSTQLEITLSAGENRQAFELER